MAKNIDSNNQLLKLLGLGFGVAVTVGGTIGTGILRKPGIIAAQIGDPYIVLLLWLLVGLYALLGVLCAIELAIAMPQAGAWYVYSKRAFGNYIGFVTGITSWLGTISALGFGAYTMSEYIVTIFPTLVGFEEFLSIGLLVILTSFHLIGTKVAGASQEVLAVIKAIGLIVFVFICFFYGKNELQSSTQFINQSLPGLTFIGLITALQSIFYTYDGWHTATYFTEENKDPSKTLPKSMISGVIVIILIYLAVNAAILYSLPVDILHNSKLAAADAINYLFGKEYGKAVTIFLMVSILGIVNAQIMFAPRVIFSMSRDKLFIKKAQQVNANGTPSFALQLTAMLSIVMIISGPKISGKLSDIATFFFVLSYLAGFCALIKLRIMESHLSASFRSPFYPYLPIVLIILSVGFLLGAIYSDLLSSMFALVFLVASYPLFLLTKSFHKS